MIRFPHRSHASETPDAGDLTGRHDLEALDRVARGLPPGPTPRELKLVSAPNLREIFGFSED